METGIALTALFDRFPGLALAVPPARSAPAPVRSRGLLALPVRSILTFGMHYVADATKALTSSTEGAYCPTGTPRP